jgi:hypothetical protein
MILIELVFDECSPDLPMARARLARACMEAGVSQRWTEWNVASAVAPARVRGFPSPAILINGCNAAATARPDASRRNEAVPPVAVIAAALSAAKAAAPDVPELPCKTLAKSRTRRSRMRR